MAVDPKEACPAHLMCIYCFAWERNARNASTLFVMGIMEW